MIGDATQVAVLASTFVDGARRPLIWTTERQSGRVFASIPGHYAWTLQDPLWRVVILRGIAWAGRREIDSLVDLIPPGTSR
jgi:type 1 glutamine amidotransferase